MLPNLPDPILDVVVPEWFSPSKWSGMEQCALSVWADQHKVLPDPVNTIIGRVLHSAREEVLTRNLLGNENTAAVRAVVERARDLAERRLETSEEPLGVPLLEAYGPHRWLQRTLWLESWARGLNELRRMPRRPEELRTSTSDWFSGGVERPWSSAALRLRGRPDEARLSGDGHVEVTDYKTGFVVGRNGEISPRVETQIQLYLLMAETLSGRPARGLLQAGAPTAVAWNEEIRERTRLRVSRFAARFPPGFKIAANAAANPGAHCSGCQLRPRCESYLLRVPKWWPNTGEYPRPLPADVWGRLSSLTEDPAGLTVRLEDVTGRRVLVRGLPAAARHDYLAAADQLFFFDLEATEDATLHGRRMHPRSFHQRSPGPKWPPARRTRVYKGS